ncbi:MAG: DNA-primase RepB domain-containing protein [Bryobacteraceae bacterium]|nr:DNA-primase RepB domain-containing protein [Bryobacteraceae bacterium]
MKSSAAKFLEQTFRPDDRIALVLVKRRSGAVTQRVAAVRQVVEPDFQVWLRSQNAQRFEVYFSPNVLRLDARGRTKGDIAEIRHVYLDFDEEGAKRVSDLASHSVPEPNFVVTSPDRYQVFWTVTGFEKEQAGSLMRHLSRETGADIAATDCSRVMRLPGFHNHKYGSPHYVRVEHHNDTIYTPDRFPEPFAEECTARSVIAPRVSPGAFSQSERDFAYALRALRCGDDPSDIAKFRIGEKSDPTAYADRTVRKAAESLAAEEELPSR